MKSLRVYLRHAYVMPGDASSESEVSVSSSRENVTPKGIEHKK